jgi:hypothetical protein
MFSQVVPKGRAKGLLVQDIFDICLDKGERFFHLPGPEGWIEGLAAFALPFNGIPATKDVSDGVRRDV